MFTAIVPGDQKGLFELAIQLRAFCYSAVCNTATGYFFRQIFDSDRIGGYA
jgi:hypothetical protein